MTYESRRASRESANTTLSRILSQRDSLQSRVAELRDQLESGVAPAQALQGELEQQLTEARTVESDLTARRQALESADHALRAEEAARADSEQRVAAVREVVDELRINAREAEVRHEGLADQFKATGRVLAEVLGQLGDETSVWMNGRRSWTR